MTCPKSCPKNGDVPKSPFSNWQAWCPSAGTISNVDVGSYRGCHRHPNCAYPCASGPGALAIGPINRSIEEERPCRFSSVTTMSTKPSGC